MSRKLFQSEDFLAKEQEKVREMALTAEGQKRDLKRLNSVDSLSSHISGESDQKEREELPKLRLEQSNNVVDRRKTAGTAAYETRLSIPPPDKIFVKEEDFLRVELHDEEIIEQEIEDNTNEAKEEHDRDCFAEYSAGKNLKSLTEMEINEIPENLNESIDAASKLTDRENGNINMVNGQVLKTYKTIYEGNNFTAAEGKDTSEELGIKRASTIMVVPKNPAGKLPLNVLVKMYEESLALSIPEERFPFELVHSPGIASLILVEQTAARESPVNEKAGKVGGLNRIEESKNAEGSDTKTIFSNVSECLTRMPPKDTTPIKKARFNSDGKLFEEFFVIDETASVMDTLKIENNCKLMKTRTIFQYPDLPETREW
eukprot:TRINITY_DN4063_c0_g1_i10.p1 TRINITY_DN4063_c0_g1~~TRINITY_DN4063_c0_g1_i10.p1  ORF type:complete len:373 (+),score=103.54 TRINITY_DN4063_c0_g1_i10:346-1464(+)